MRKILLLMSCLVLLAGLSLVLTPSVHAAAYTWTGAGADNNWSTCGNWGGTCPIATDTVTFNGTSTKDAVIDTSFTGTVAQVTISAAYSGTITTQRSLTVTGSYSQAGGTVNLGTTTGMQFTGNFALSGGTFTSSTQMIQFGGNFTHSGGTFNHNGGSTNFTNKNATFSCIAGTVFNLVTFNNLDGQSQIKVNTAACTLPLGHNPVIDREGFLLKGATLTGSGLLTISGLTGTLALESNAQITGFDALDIYSLSVSTNFDASHFDYINFHGGPTLNSGTFIAPPIINQYGDDWFGFGGVFNANGGTVNFIYTDRQQIIVTFTTQTFHNLTIDANRPDSFRFAGNVAVTGTFTAVGQSSSQLLSLDQMFGTTWNINATGPTNLRNLLVSQSVNSGPTLYATGQAGLNNTNWVFDNAGPTAPGSVTVPNPTKLTMPTLTWNPSVDAVVDLGTPTYTIQWCQNDQFSGCDSQVATTNDTAYTLTQTLTDGTWYFRVKAQDELGNYSDYATASTFIDTQSPPLPELIFPHGYSRDNNRPTLAFRKVIDAQTSINHYKVTLQVGEKTYEYNSIPAQTPSLAHVTNWIDSEDVRVTFLSEDDSNQKNHEIHVFFKKLDVLPLTEGDYRWSVTAVDQAGNESTQTTDFGIDQTAPMIVEKAFGGFVFGVDEKNLINTIKLNTYQRMPFFSGRAVDVIHGPVGDKGVTSKPATVTLMMWRWNSKQKNHTLYISKTYTLPESSLTKDNSQTRFYFQTPFPLVDGTYTATIFSKDQAGNRSSLDYFTVLVNQNILPKNITVTDPSLLQ